MGIENSRMLSLGKWTLYLHCALVPESLLPPYGMLGIIMGCWELAGDAGNYHGILEIRMECQELEYKASIFLSFVQIASCVKLWTYKKPLFVFD